MVFSAVHSWLVPHVRFSIRSILMMYSTLQESGFPGLLPTLVGGQSLYNLLVNATGCANETDTLTCLQDVPAQVLLDAVNETPGYLSYSALDLAWTPRIDGEFVARNPLQSVAQGLYAKVGVVASFCAGCWLMWSGIRFQ